MPYPTRERFIETVRSARAARTSEQAPVQGGGSGSMEVPGGVALSGVAVPVALRVLADQLTPVLAYRRLVSPDAREAPSFLLESVEGGERQGRYSILGAHPMVEVVAREHEVRIIDHRGGGAGGGGAGGGGADRVVGPMRVEDPLGVLRGITRGVRFERPTAEGVRDALPGCFLGGWAGFVGYDAVRYAEPGKLPFGAGPRDDRGLPDVHMGMYDGVIVFDHVDKVMVLVQVAIVGEGEDPGRAYDVAVGMLRSRLADVERGGRMLASGVLDGAGSAGGSAGGSGGGSGVGVGSNMTREEHASMVSRALEYIRAGDVFQVVLGQRFERVSRVDPFDVYRALRTVNPSPYMVYMQGEGTILVGSSPEILCRVRRGGGGGSSGGGVVTNRPLAGTRRRGATAEEDAALERELLADAKERAEHVMLVDLGRNDVGVVARPGTVATPTVMEVERYSHVMHISSTVTGELRAGLDCWDALRAALPVGTISGAPKVRAMQIIDELEPCRRGPYGGGMGYVGLDGQMDIALTLRTIVAPFAQRREGAWTYHVQASGGIVADSSIPAEYEETVNKAAALGRAIDAAERAFGRE